MEEDKGGEEGEINRRREKGDGEIVGEQNDRRLSKKNGRGGQEKKGVVKDMEVVGEERKRGETRRLLGILRRRSFRRKRKIRSIRRSEKRRLKRR